MKPLIRTGLRLAPILYFLIVSLPHHPFSYWLDDAFIVPLGFLKVQHVADIGSLLLMAGVVFLGASTIAGRRGGRLRHAVLLAIVIALMYYTDRWLIVNNMERIHYPQYALLALLFGLTLRSEVLIFFLTSFAGVVDEFLQYVMNPLKSNYFDFNDIVLNILGAAAGTVLMMWFHRDTLPAAAPDIGGAGNDDEKGRSYEWGVRGAFLSMLIALGVVVTFALLSGRIAPLVETKQDRSALAVVDGKLSFILSFERHESFWAYSDFGKVFHILTPLEGLTLSAALLVLTWLGIRWLSSRSVISSR